MKTYWMFWWGRTTSPLHELNPLHWIGVMLVILFFCAICVVGDLPVRVLLCMATSALIWVYWISQAKKMNVPVNLLVPGFHQRLLKTSMAHWLIATLLLAFAATVRGRLDYFFTIGLLLGYGLLALTWLTRLRNAWIAVPGSMGLIWGAWYFAKYLRFDDDSSFVIAILAMGWVVMPVLAWQALNTLLRDGTANKSDMEQVRRRVPFRDALHHWFLRRMMRACNNTALPPKVLERVRLEARLNTCFGPKFHWISFFVSWQLIFFALLVLPGTLLRNGDSTVYWFGFFASEIYLTCMSLNIFHFYFSYILLPKNYKKRIEISWKKIFTSDFGDDFKIKIDKNAVLINKLVFFAPGLPQGLALHQALAHIRLRYFLIVWTGTVALYALAFSGLDISIRYHAIVMIATAELAMAGKFVGSPLDIVIPSFMEDRLPSILSGPISFLLLIFWPTVSTKYVWFLFMVGPSWYIESISLSLWTASCLLGGAAYLCLRWQKLANEPEGLPAGWR